MSCPLFGSVDNITMKSNFSYYSFCCGYFSSLNFVHVTNTHIVTSVTWILIHFQVNSNLQLSSLQDLCYFLVMVLRSCLFVTVKRMYMYDIIFYVINIQHKFSLYVFYLNFYILWTMTWDYLLYFLLYTGRLMLLPCDVSIT